jgi:hypothetical protein
VIRRSRKPTDRAGKLLAETQESIGKLLKQNRTLKQQNAKLAKELDRVSQGWEEIKKLARSAPRARRRR